MRELVAASPYCFTITCPLCGGQVEHVADGRASTNECRAVARCADGCGELVVKVELFIGSSFRRVGLHRGAAA